MSLNFTEVVTRRCENECDEECMHYYFQVVDALIEPIYLARYRTLEPQITGAVNFESYVNSCWEKMEGSDDGFGRLLTEICNNDFANDAALVRFIQVAFEHLLQDMIYAQSPGLRTRVQQLNRVLNDICEPYQNRKYWRIRGTAGVPDLPTSAIEELDELRSCLTDCPPPEPEYPKSTDAIYGMAIRDVEMRSFLERVITKIGGVVSKNSLIAFIAEIYNMTPVITDASLTGPTRHEDDGESVNFEEIFKDLSMTQEYTVLARELIEGCLETLVPVFTYLYCERLDQTKIAAKLNIANSTVTNRKRDIESCFIKFKQEVPMLEDELIAFVKLICSIIQENNEARNEA